MNHSFPRFHSSIAHSSLLAWLLTGIPGIAHSSVHSLPILQPDRALEHQLLDRTASLSAPLLSKPSLSEPSLRTLYASGLDFSDIGRPRRRQGGGSRGSCLIANQPPLTALVTESSTGYTLAQSPRFWFYLPYSLSTGHSIEFVLKDSQDNLVHSQSIAGKDTTAGIINLRLPESIVLETNQSYEWYLLVQCDASNSERFVFVNGAIRRLDRPQLQQQLASLTPTEQSELYKAQNLWYDAIDAIALQLQSTPENPALRQSWTTLLDQIGLSTLATEPIAPCCTMR